MKYRKYWKKFAIFSAVLLLVLTVLYGGLRFLEATVLRPGQPDREAVSQTVIRNGIEYYPRRDITVILMLGIGGDSAGQEQLEAVELLIFDEKNASWSTLQLRCDTVLDMDAPDEDGMGAAVIRERLVLAYTYGEDPEERCNHTRRAVSDFLNGITIDHYIAADVDVIDRLKDASADTAFDLLAEAHSAAADLVTDGPLYTLISMGNRYQNYQFAGAYTPEGELADDGENIGFYADKDKLDDLVIDLFYAPKPGQ